MGGQCFPCVDQQEKKKAQRRWEVTFLCEGTSVSSCLHCNLLCRSFHSSWNWICVWPQALFKNKMQPGHFVHMNNTIFCAFCHKYTQIALTNADWCSLTGKSIFFQFHFGSYFLFSSEGLLLLLKRWFYFLCKGLFAYFSTVVPCHASTMMKLAHNNKIITMKPKLHYIKKIIKVWSQRHQNSTLRSENREISEPFRRTCY